MFNPTFTTYQPQQLIVPNKGNEGWQTIGTGVKVAGGLMSWLDKKKQAQRLQEAQDKWYDALSSYLNSQNESDKEVIEEEPVEEENVYTRFLPVRSSTDEEQMALANRMAKESSEEEAFDNYRRALALAQFNNSRGGF